MFVAKFVVRNKRILVGPNIVIAVRPRMDPTAAIEARFGRQRRPADIIFARSPRDPGWRPFISRHPDPTDPAQPEPAPIVISRPAERLIGDPGPTRIAINPAALCVRTPVARFLRLARLPDVTVIRRFAPRAVRFQFSIKHPVRRSRSSLGSGLGARLGIRFGSLFDSGLGRGDRFFSNRRLCRSTLLGRQRFLARLEIRLLLCETLLLILQAFRGHPFLHLPLHFRFPFLFGLLFLARNKNRQSGDKRQNDELLHGVVRQGWLLVIRIKLWPSSTWR